MKRWIKERVWFSLQDLPENFGVALMICNKVCGIHIGSLFFYVWLSDE